MKEIIVTSKNDFPGMVSSHPGKDWAYISIEGTPDLVSTGLISGNTHYLPEGPDVLNLEFDDIEEDCEFTYGNDKYKAYSVTDEQITKILDFAEGHKEYNLIIHCYAGKSRSVAVAQGLLDCFPGVWKLGKESNLLSTPNMKVLRLIHRKGLY